MRTLIFILGFILVGCAGETKDAQPLAPVLTVNGKACARQTSVPKWLVLEAGHPTADQLTVFHCADQTQSLGFCGYGLLDSVIIYVSDARCSTANARLE